ncbi:MAG: hypothetical protein Q4C22_04190 [Bacillota bacterium]|nr:hypothetical protein [Bacillota bacterium]
MAIERYVGSKASQEMARLARLEEERLIAATKARAGNRTAKLPAANTVVNLPPVVSPAVGLPYTSNSVNIKSTPKKSAALPLASWESVLSAYNVSLPGIGLPYARNMEESEREKLVQQTQQAFEERPMFTGFLEGFSLNSPKASLEKKIGEIDTSETEGTVAHKAGKIAGELAQFAAAYGVASPGVIGSKAAGVAGRVISNMANAQAAINAVKAGKSAVGVTSRITPEIGRRIAGSAGTTLLVDLPLNANIALNKEGLRGTEAVKNIALNTGLDLVAGGVLEGLPYVVKGAKRVLPDIKTENDFMRQVTDVMLDRKPVHEVLTLGQTPEILQKYGAKARPMTMKQSDVRKIAYPQGYLGLEQGHNLGFEALRLLHRNIKNPAAILKSGSQDNSLVIFTKMLDSEGRPVMAAVHLDKNGNIGLSNEIASVYGRNEYENFISAQRQAGNVLYENKKMGLDDLLLNGLQLPAREAKSDPIFNIYNSQGNVKKNVSNAQTRPIDEMDLGPSPNADVGVPTANGVGLSPDNIIRSGSANVNPPNAPKPPSGTTTQGIRDLGADTARPADTMQEAIDQYGTLRKGETVIDKDGNVLTKEAEVPKATRYGDTSQHAQTIKEAKSMEALSDEIDSALLDGDFTKHTKTNKAAVEEANATIAESGLDNAYAAFKVKSRSDTTPTSGDIALGYRLVQEFIKKGDHAKALEVLEDVTFMLSESARTLQAARMLKRLTPEGRLATVQRTAAKISKKTGADVKISPKTAKRIAEATDDNDIQDIFDDAVKEIWEQVPPTFADKFNAWRYTAMLGNLKTIGRNEVSNSFSYLMRYMKDALGTPMEAALVRAGKMNQMDRTKTILTRKDKHLVELGREQAQKRMSDLQGQAKYADISTTGRPIDVSIFGRDDAKLTQRLKEINPKLGKATQTFGKGIEAWRAGTNTLLNDGWKIIQGDKGWLTRVYGNSFAKIMKSRGITADMLSDKKLLDEIHEAAKLEAQRATFRDANKVSDYLSKSSAQLRASEKTGEKMLGYGIEAAVPFKRTPLNLLRRSIDYSPVGVIQSGFKFARSSKTGDIAGAIDRLAAGLTGSAVAILGWYLASQGLLKVTIPRSKEGDFGKLQGEQPYSLEVEIAGQPVSATLNWLVPAAVPLFLGAEWHNAREESGADLGAFIDSIANIADPVFEMSMLQGLSNMLDTNAYGDGNVFSGIAKGVGNLGFSLVGQTVPTLAGQVARSIDPVGYRTNTSDKEGKLASYLGYNVNKNIVSKLPFISQTREPNVDRWGRTQEKEGVGEYTGNTLENLLSPAYMNRLQTTEVDEEIARLYEMNGNTGILPPDTSEWTLTQDGKSYRMTGEERTEYMKLRGQTAYDELSRLIKSAEYRAMNQTEKENAIEKVYSDAAYTAKMTMLTKAGQPTTIWLSDLGKTVTDNYSIAKAAGISPERYRDTYKEMMATVNAAGVETHVAKALVLAENRANAAYYEAFGLSDEAVKKAEKVLARGLTANEYYRIALAVKDIEKSSKKRQYIVEHYPDLTSPERRAVYDALGI